MRNVSNNEDALFALLRVGLGTGGAAAAVPALSPGDWDGLYRMAGEQSVLGIAYAGIERLLNDAQPPMELAFQWASEAETVRGHNRMLCKPDAFRGRWRLLRCLPFAPAEVFWTGVDFVVTLVRSIPVRIRLRRFSLEGLQ